MPGEVKLPQKPKDSRPFWVLIIGLILITALALVLFGCVEISQDLMQQAPTPVFQPTATPTSPVSPTPTPPPVARVSVVEFTGRDGVNCGAAPNLVMGCRALLTCTPRDVNGNDVGPRYIPEWATLGALTFNPTSINFYNGRAECSQLGVGAVSCTVGGVHGMIQLTCVAAP